MIQRTLFLAALFGSAACSGQSPGQSPAPGPQPTAVAARPAPAPAPTPTPTLPDNAPATGIRNVPATTGRANRAQTPPPFRVERIGRFDAPFAMAFLPDGRLLVTEKAGRLKLRGTDGRVTDVAGVPTVAQGGQGGLLDVAPAPDFATSGTLYLTYGAPAEGGSQLALARATLDAGAVPRLTGVSVIWRSGSPGPGGQFGAAIVFAPDGRSLFLSSGERQRFTPAQDPAQGLGKIVHLSLDGQPVEAGAAFPGTYTSGHRNPYGLVFTPDGRLWEVEMGPKGGDELNLIERGRNYGWPVVSNGDNYSGQPIPDHPSRPDLAAPVLWWNPSISPSSLMLYTGALFPRYRGSLFVGAMSTAGLIRVEVNGAAARPAEFWDMGARIRDVAQAPDGAIWLLEDTGRGSNGGLLRLTPRQ